MASYELSKTKRNLIVSVMLISAFVAILNQTLLNTALPHIMRELNINENTSQWLITGFMLVNGVMIPLTAYLMDKVKTRPLYLGAMGSFLIGSIVAAIAPNFGVLMIARVIQAVGAGILTHAINAIYIVYIVLQRTPWICNGTCRISYTICTCNWTYIYWFNH